MSKWIIEELKRMRDSDLTTRVFSWDRNISCLSQTLGQINHCEYMQMKDRKRKGRGGMRKKTLKVWKTGARRNVQKRKRDTQDGVYNSTRQVLLCTQGSERKRVGRIQGKKGHLKTCFDSHTFLHRKSRREITLILFLEQHKHIKKKKVWNIIFYGSTSQFLSLLVNVRWVVCVSYYCSFEK